MKIWYDIEENDVKRLYNDPRYPDNPDKVKILSSFHTGQNIADNYGSILSPLYGKVLSKGLHANIYSMSILILIYL